MTGSTAVVPFGKYKGEPVEVVLADKGYLDWITAQPWVRDRYGDFYQTVINYGGPPADTPEHNEMQAGFLDDELCLRLARHVWAGRDFTRRAALLAVPDNERAVLRRFADHLVVDYADARVAGRQFENAGWDVTYGIVPPHVSTCRRSLPPCTCGPCDHSGCIPTSKCRGGKYPCHHEGYETSHEARRAILRERIAHDDGTARYRSVYENDYDDGSGRLRIGDHQPHCAWPAASVLLENHSFEPRWENGIVRVECKPDLGDDFPAVLRQVTHYDRDDSDRCCVVVRRASFERVTWEQVTEMFAASKITLLRATELETDHAEVKP